MMYCLINETTGLSVGFIECPESAIALNTPSGCTAIQADVPVGNYVLRDGNLISIGDPPEPWFMFDVDRMEWVDTRSWEKIIEDQWRKVRTKRNDLLAASDWTQLPDVPLATKEAWAAYRQALRDITEQPDPFNIVWPVPPG